MWSSQCLACVARAPSPASGPELSQYLRTTLFYLSQKDKALQKQGWNLPSEVRHERSETRPHTVCGGNGATGLQPPESVFDFSGFP